MANSRLTVSQHFIAGSRIWTYKRVFLKTVFFKLVTTILWNLANGFLRNFNGLFSAHVDTSWTRIILFHWAVFFIFEKSLKSTKFPKKLYNLYPVFIYKCLCAGNRYGKSHRGLCRDCTEVVCTRFNECAGSLSWWRSQYILYLIIETNYYTKIQNTIAVHFSRELLIWCQ